MNSCCHCLLNAVVHGLTVDTVADKIYFTYMTVVEMVNPDGSGRTRVIERPGVGITYGIAVDIAHRSVIEFVRVYVCVWVFECVRAYVRLSTRTYLFDPASQRASVNVCIYI